MNHTLLLAALFAAMVSTSVMAHANPLNTSPSPTVVYSDLVTTGSPYLDDDASDSERFEMGSAR